jgi:hypothetical protein
MPPPGVAPPPPPPGYVPPLPIIEEASNPARKLVFTLLGLAVLLGLAGAGVFLSVKAFLDLDRDVDALARGPLPVAELELEADARETIYLEVDGIAAGDSDSPNPRAERLKSEALSAEVRVSRLGRDGASDTVSIPVEGVSGETVYSFGREGIAVGRIAVPEDGTYRIEVSGFAHDGDVAVGDVSFGGLFKDFGIGLGLFMLGIVLCIPLFRLRRPRRARG